tara:strand:- start:1224 stop:2012 length:789 start_codon:yes stop_codon:yes gene_type:complete
LKNVCPDVTLNIKKDNLYIQGLCSAHVLMFELNISNDWFDYYESSFDSQVNLGINCEILFKIINCIGDGQMIKFEYNQNKADKLIIMLDNINDNSKTPQKSFELSLMDIDNEYLEVPEIASDIELTISSEQIVQIINEMSQFGSDVKFQCNEDNIILESVGDGNKMNVQIKESDIESYAIVEDLNYNSVYSLKYLQNITAFQKLNKNIDIIFIEDNPAMFIYNLNERDWKDYDESDIEEENDEEDKPAMKNIIKFYLAPKLD